MARLPACRQAGLQQDDAIYKRTVAYIVFLIDTCALSSVVEHRLDVTRVVGSIATARIKTKQKAHPLLGCAHKNLVSTMRKIQHHSNVSQMMRIFECAHLIFHNTVQHLFKHMTPHLSFPIHGSVE